MPDTPPTSAAGWPLIENDLPPAPDPNYCIDWSARPLFALDADVTVYWPDVRPCYEEAKSA